MGNTIIKKLAYDKLYFINVDGAIRQLKYLGNKVRHSHYNCTLYSDLVFVDSKGKEYFLSDNYSAIYDTLDNAIKNGATTCDKTPIDVNDLIRAKGGRIGMSDVQFVSWKWNEKENKSEQYSVAGRGYERIEFALITTDGVKYLTENNREITPKSCYFLTKEQCDAANIDKLNIVLFN